MLLSETTPLPVDEVPIPTERKPAPVLDFSGEPQPIGPLTERADWPRCAVGLFVRIHGFEGVVVEHMGQSLKVVSSEKVTQRFNVHRLKTLFAPPPQPRPVLAETPPSVASTPEPEVEPSEEAAAPRHQIQDPDFTQPVRAISTFAGLSDFPECVLGKHVDIPGYAGVVVEVIKGSLKVQTPEGIVRRYNVSALRKLYGRL